MNSEWLHDFCTSLKGVSTDIKWEDNLTYLIGNKLFAITGTDIPFRVSFKVEEEEFAMLIEREGIIQAPYFAKNQWVMIKDPASLDKEEWEKYLQKSYDLVLSKLSKKLQNEINTQ